MDWREVTFVTIATFLCFLPLGLVLILVLTRIDWKPDLSQWRYRFWLGGLTTAAVSSLPLPIFLLTLSLHHPTWSEQFATLLSWGLVLAPISAVLLSFGKGKQRWIGLGSALLATLTLYVSALSLSY
jgi:hypothetical protein